MKKFKNKLKRQIPAGILRSIAVSACIVLYLTGCGEFTLPGKSIIESIPVKVFSDISFAVIPTGTCTCGSPEDECGHMPNEKRHFVTFTEKEQFALMQTEVTIMQYWTIMDPSRTVDKSKGKYPMTKVSWEMAAKFCQKLSEKIPGKTFRLPKEDEWEYACRAGSSGMFGCKRIVGEIGLETKYGDSLNKRPGGDKLSLERRTHSCFSWDESSIREVKKAGDMNMSDPNAWGLFDMHGNAWEWCEFDRVPLKSSKEKPIRGGAYTSSHLEDCRSAHRATEPADAVKGSIGFRVLLENP